MQIPLRWIAPAAMVLCLSTALADAVYTRGEFRGRSRQGGRDYVHIKVAVGSKIPFSTLTYRIKDVPVPADIANGARVDFRAERVEGENVLVDIRWAGG